MKKINQVSEKHKHYIPMEKSNRSFNLSIASTKEGSIMIYCLSNIQIQTTPSELLGGRYLQLLQKYDGFITPISRKTNIV
jgi:hypothetical protein